MYKQAAFDWPLGPLGRIRQKYGKPKVPKSKSEDQLAEVGDHHKAGQLVEQKPGSKSTILTTRLGLKLARG